MTPSRPVEQLFKSPLRHRSNVCSSTIKVLVTPQKGRSAPGSTILRPVNWLSTALSGGTVNRSERSVISASADERLGPCTRSVNLIGPIGPTGPDDLSVNINHAGNGQ
jgi:hypothetical protein